MTKRSWLDVPAQDAAGVQQGPVHRPRRCADLLRGPGDLPAALAVGVDPRLRGPDPEKSVQTSVDVLRQPLGRRGLPRRRSSRSLPGPPASPVRRFALVFGLALRALVGVGYVAAFSSAMNRIYEIDEGRPFWKLRRSCCSSPFRSCCLPLVMRDARGQRRWHGRSATRSAWVTHGPGRDIAKWPVMSLAVMLIVAILYYATPERAAAEVPLDLLGAAVAILIWMRGGRRVRLLRRQLRLVQQDLRLAGRRGRRAWSACG